MLTTLAGGLRVRGMWAHFYVAIVLGIDGPPVISEIAGREVPAGWDVLLCHVCLSLAEYFCVNIVLCTLN